MKHPPHTQGLISGSDLCLLLFSLPSFPHTLLPICLLLSLSLLLSFLLLLPGGPFYLQKKIMIIICCVVLGVVLASSIGGTLGL